MKLDFEFEVSELTDELKTADYDQSCHSTLAKYLTMSLSLDEHRIKLINKILFAASQEEVKRFIDAAIKALEQNKVNGHIISRFIEKIISDLGLFNPMKKEAQQWSNIKFAGILFNRIKHHSTAEVS